MIILITGSSGLIGSALVRHLNSKGHQIKTLVRRDPANPFEIAWNPPERAPDAPLLEGIDAVVHLAGESIAAGRWSESKKAQIRESRSAGTLLLAKVLAGLKKPPKVLISASAIGYYGDRGEEVLREDSAPGKDFLADVCRAWEAATEPATQKGIRVVHTRFGIILSPKGGALAKMLLPFKMGLGGKIGSGRQYMSWITVDDAIGAIAFSLFTESIRGAVNVVSPKPLTNADYTKILGRVLGRPTLFPMPTFAARLAFGEMADALLLSSARVEPAVLASSGYPFQFADLESALRHLLNR